MVFRIRKMVSFELSKEIGKDVFRFVTSVGQRKKFRVPLRKRTSDLRIPRSDALSHGDSVFSLSHAREKTKNIFLQCGIVAKLRISHEKKKKKDLISVYFKRSDLSCEELVKLQRRIIKTSGLDQQARNTKYLTNRESKPWLSVQRSLRNDRKPCLNVMFILPQHCYH